jgi:hypothetical protein
VEQVAMSIINYTRYCRSNATQAAASASDHAIALIDAIRNDEPADRIVAHAAAALRSAEMYRDLLARSDEAEAS